MNFIVDNFNMKTNDGFDGFDGWHTNTQGDFHYIDGKLHSLADAPSFIHKDGTRMWHFRGLLHRLNKPAIIEHNFNKYYYKDNYYRLDGPAIEYKNDPELNYWILNGRVLGEVNYRNKLRNYPISFYTDYTDHVDYVNLYINEYNLISPVESGEKIKCRVLKLGPIRLALVPFGYGFVLERSFLKKFCGKQCGGVYLISPNKGVYRLNNEDY